MNLNPAKIPAALTDRQQWCVWKTIHREGDKPTKVPYQTNGRPASSTNPETWNAFEAALGCFEGNADYSGIGYVFAADDPFVGIDLDGCRNPETMEIAPWAKDLILKLDTYGEVSPSQTGVKLWLVGANPLGTSGRKASVPDAPAVCDKQPAIEIYDRARYFAVTGWRMKGPETIEPNEPALKWLVETYFAGAAETSSQTSQDWHGEAAVIERARKYLAKLPAAVSGSGGHNAAFHAACMLVLGFGLPEGAALSLMHEWNQACVPPWSDRELVHKVKQAAKQPGPRNYLRIAKPDNYSSVSIPTYRTPPPEVEKSQPKKTMLADAMKEVVNDLRDGRGELLSLGLGELDYAIGGGIEPGELIIMAARSSHGKSSLALQCIHHWSAIGKPVLFISEEMSPKAIAKRSVQFFSAVPERDWKRSLSQLDQDIAKYIAANKAVHILESCVTCDAAIEQIEKHVAEQKVEAVVVDYAQMLRGKGMSKYEQVSYTSTAMKQCAARLKIPLILICQLNRAIETRTKFVPVMSDIKDSGQFEQDADVILFLVWPWKIDSANPEDKYQIFVGKNRNRATVRPCVECRFNAARQMILESEAKSMPNYEPAFDAYNNQHEEPFQ